MTRGDRSGSEQAPETPVPEPTADEVRDALRAVVGRFDPAVVSAADAAELVTVFAEIERLAASARLLAAGRMARTSVWVGEGDADVAEWMARRTGQSRADARRDLAAARALDDLDDTRDAMRRGQLTKEQVREIAPTAVLAPGSERDLLDEAASGSVDRLVGKARAAKAAARRDGRDAVQQLRRRRSVVHGPADDGGHWLRVYGPPDDVARIQAGLSPWARAAAAQARARGEHLTDQQARFDGLVAMASEPHAVARPASGADPDTASARLRTGDDDALDHDGLDDDPAEHLADASAPRRRWSTKVIVNVDLQALRRGFALPGERCSITGIGPVPVAVVDDLLDRDDTFLAAVLRDGEDIQKVAHLGRGPTARQRTALQASHDRCCIDGCPDPPAVIDHHHRFADDGSRHLDNLGPLCPGHDDRKSHDGWVLVRHGRSRRLVPPDHPLAAGVQPGGCLDLDDLDDLDDGPSTGGLGAARPSAPPARAEQLGLLAG